MSVVVLAYSGGRGSRRALAELVAADRDVATLSLDVGQGGDLADVRAEALANGAVRAHVLDSRESFSSDVLLPALQAGARLDGHLPTPRALLAPWIASQLAVVAKMEATSLVAHGALGMYEHRLNVCLGSSRPNLTVIHLTGPARADVASDPLLADANVWGRTLCFDFGTDTWNEADEAFFTLTEAPVAASDTPAVVEVECQAGVPVAVNGVAMPFFDLFTSLDTIAGDHGVGRLDIIDRTLGATARRVVVEAPAAVVLDTALRALEALVFDPPLARLSRQVGEAYGDMLAEGTWSLDARDAALAFARDARRRMTGTVRVRLYKGECRVVGRRSSHSRCGS